MPPDTYNFALRLPQKLGQQVKRDSEYRGRSMNETITRYCALGVALSVLAAAQDAEPGDKTAERAVKAAKSDVDALLRSTFGRPLPAELLEAAAIPLTADLNPN